MTQENIGMLIAMALYMAGVLAIGIRCCRRNKTSDDFYLGGRQLSPLVTAMSAEASDMSSWLLMGLPGLAYLSGAAESVWTAVGLAIGTYVNWLIVAKRLRRYTVVAKNSITIPDFFSNRFGDKNRILMSISAIMILIFFVPYTASGFAACGKLFNSLFNVPYVAAMIVSAIVIVAYTAIGGFLAASTTDLMQSILMTCALVAVLLFGVVTAGGVGAVIDNAQQLPGFLDLFQKHVAETNSSTSYSFFSILSNLAWGLGYFGMPHILLRFMAIRSEHAMKTSRRIATVWVVITLTIAIVIGIVGLAAIPGLKDSETIFIELAKLLGNHSIISALFAGMIVAGILAATMSTADSQLLAASSSIAQNFFKGLVYKKASNKQVMWVARGTVIAIAVIGAFIASNPNSSVFGIVSFAWAGFGATFGPLVLFALFWKRTTLVGAVSGIVSGGIVVFFWHFLVIPYGVSNGINLLTIYELLPAFLVSCAAIVIGSLLSKKPSDITVKEFELAASDMPLEQAEETL